MWKFFESAGSSGMRNVNPSTSTKIAVYIGYTAFGNPQSMAALSPLGSESHLPLQARATVPGALAEG